MAIDKYISRRNFIRAGAVGIAAVGAGSLILRANERPTPGSGRAHAPMPEPFGSTERNIQGPFFREHALNRARLITDENGDYEFETVHPGPYPLDETRLRPSHIHYRVSHPQHKTLITQIYFKGDPHIVGDPYVKPQLIIDLDTHSVGDASYELGVFDIVLGPPKPKPVRNKL